jgi:hypothetical protein
VSNIQGGSYADVKGQEGKHGHHVYPFASYDGVLELSRREGPAISMEPVDHRELLTTSGGPNSPQNAERQERRSLIEQGNFREAWMMDVRDIQSNFGDKYDTHLAYAERHLLELDKEKKVQLEDKFKEELTERQKILESIEKNQKEQQDIEQKELLEKQDLEKQEQLKQEAEKYKAELREQYEKNLQEKSEIEVQKDSYESQALQEKPKDTFSFEEFEKDEFDSY